MFGVVPKTLWAKKTPPDERNRILLAMRPLVVRGSADDAHRRRPRRQGRPQVSRDLRRRSVAQPRSHAGRGRPDAAKTSTSCWPRTCTSITRAASRRATRAGRRAAGVSRARSTSSGAASGRTRGTPNERNRASYLADNFLPLADAGVLQLVDDDQTIMPGVTVRRTGGHTMHHQMAIIESGGKTAAFVADLRADDGASARAVDHGLRPVSRWTRWPRRRRSTRTRIEKDTLVFFEHDPAVAAGHIREEQGKRRIVPAQSRS